MSNKSEAAKKSWEERRKRYGKSGTNRKRYVLNKNLIERLKKKKKR